MKQSKVPHPQRQDALWGASMANLPGIPPNMMAFAAEEVAWTQPSRPDRSRRRDAIRIRKLTGGAVLVIGGILIMVPWHDAPLLDDPLGLAVCISGLAALQMRSVKSYPKRPRPVERLEVHASSKQSPSKGTG